MKKLIILLLTLILILGVLASCNSKRYLTIDDETSASPSENITTEDNQGGITTDGLTEDTLPDFEDETTKPGEVKYVTSYEVKKVGDQWYMIFDSYIANPADQTYFPPRIGFESLRSLKSDILNHRLTLASMNTIVSSFTRDNIGVPIFDLDNIYASTASGDRIIDDNTSWSSRNFWTDGEYYQNAFYKDLDDDNGIIYPLEDDIELTIIFQLMSKENFENEYNRYAQTHSTRTIQNENKIIKLFVYESNLIYMLIKEGEYYYSYIIDGFDELPDDETLLSYGIEKYE